MVVYLITDNTNGKQYVGQTIYTAEQRFARHCMPSSFRCRLLSRAIKAHGAENFTVSVLEEVDSREALDERECYWIEQLNTMSPNGYNLVPGGTGKGEISEETRARMSAARKGKCVGKDNPFYGKKHTEESKRKMRENHRDIHGEKNPNRGRVFTPEQRKAISDRMSGENHPCWGKHLSPETRAKISAANRGKRLSEESIRKMAETKRGRKLSLEHRAKLSEIRKGTSVGGENPQAKRVVCVETGEVFETIKEAAEFVGVWPENMSRHLRGLSSCCGKLHWKYFDERG